MQAFSTLEPVRRSESGRVDVRLEREASPALLLLDQRPMLRDCLARSIAAEWPQARIAALGFDALGTLAADATLDACILSVDAAGIELLQAVAAALPGTPCVVLSDEAGEAAVTRAAALGAQAYFSTSAPLPVLVQGVKLVLVGGTAFPRPVSLPPVPPAPSSTQAAEAPTAFSRFGSELFTPKELEVLGSLARGRPNKLIAHELTICETTVKVHLRHIFRKLGTTNRTHAALLAREMLEALPLPTA